MRGRLLRRLLIIFGVLFGVQFYIWSRVVAPLGDPWRSIGTIVLAVLAPSLFYGRSISRRLTRAQAKPWLYITYVWFGLATYLFLAAMIGDVVHLFANIDRRTLALVELGSAAAVVAYGIGHVARGPVVRSVEIRLPKLGRPYRLVQLTDVHIGPMLGQKFARGVVDKVNALEPDLIVLTGDIVDGRLTELREHVEPLRDLRAKDGVYAVSGNHEYYWNGDAWLDYLAGMGIHVLRNRNVTIADAFVLAGTDDVTATEDLPAALAGCDRALPVVLLAHHPSTVARARTHGVDLQLSGHTHGGQLLPLGWLCRLFEPLAAGLGRFGDTQLYVSEGTGFWGPPLRVGTTQEITQISLTPA